MPFCHTALEVPKLSPSDYPQELVTIGDHLRKRRLDLGLLQREVAERMGVDVSSIHNWERGRTSPPPRFVPRIVEFLGYVPYDLSKGTLGQRVVAARHLLGLTQRELAHRLGVDPSTLGRWERGEGQPSKGLLGRVGALLDSFLCGQAEVAIATQPPDASAPEEGR